MESEKRQRRSGTSGEEHAVIYLQSHCWSFGFFTRLLTQFLFTLFPPCRQKEKEQMEALRKHHAEEIEHHKKEIERLQREIDRHKGKIRKLKHDD